MKAAWQVVLTRTPTQNDFRDGYFPRNFFRKVDATALKAEVLRKGGDAEVVRVRPTAKVKGGAA